VECYDLKKNEWRGVAPMAEPHYGHAGAVHGGLMYVSGESNTHTPHLAPSSPLLSIFFLNPGMKEGIFHENQ